MTLRSQSNYEAALGFRAHSGWAVMVAVGGPGGVPALLIRRRIELASPKIAGSPQLYHTAKGMSLPDAAAFVERCAVATEVLAQTAIRGAIPELAERGYRLSAACVLLGSGRALGNLGSILASHALIHTAEGQFYRNALATACQACGLTSAGLPERDLLSRAAKILQLPSADIQQRISELGKTAGPPWRQDEKLSALAGWIALTPSPQL